MTCPCEPSGVMMRTGNFMTCLLFFYLILLPGARQCLNAVYHCEMGAKRFN